ncbi:hypothetical protein HKBW3S47_02247, partial [Candidatus Hakubella thermalkaliphila]
KEIALHIELRFLSIAVGLIVGLGVEPASILATV